jgi:hypothetical protein
MSRFVVDLGNVQLSEEENNAIAASIQEAVLSHFAASPPKQMTHMALIPIRWRGIVFRPTTSELEQAERQIEPFASRRSVP